MEVLAFSINDTAKALGIGRSSVYALLKSGKLDAIKIGRRTLLTTDSIERLAQSPFRNVLSSAIGADEALPVVTRVDIRERRTCLLMCSDGLTKHVTNAEIESAFREIKSSEQLVRELLDLALSRGGSDNITIIAARAPVRQTQSA